MSMRQRAVPKGSSDNANPQTWDWQPMKVRENYRRNQIERKCNDMCWAIALVIAVLAFIGFGIFGATQVNWATSSAQKDGVFTEDFIWKCVLQILIASSFGIVFALVWSYVLRACAGVMIKMSIFIFLGLKVAGIVTLVVAGAFTGTGTTGALMGIAIFMGISVLIHCIYFCCVWKRIPMAEATLTIATKVLHRYSCVFWVALLFSLMTIMWIFLSFFAHYGVMKICGFDYTMTETMGSDTQNDGALQYLIWIGTALIFFWGAITIGYIVHAVAAGVMGTWYFGTSRKRTVTDAVVRALTTSLGSISFAAFIVAVIRVMEMMANNAEENARREGNLGGLILAAMLKCIIRCLGDLMNYFNSLAIVRVAVYGESFCTSAKRTMNMIKYRGMDQLINDDLSGMPVWLGCWIVFMITVPCMFSVIKWVPGCCFIVSSAGATAAPEIWMWSFLFALCALFIPISMLSVIPSFVQSLYVLWGDDPAALDEVHPQEAGMLKAAAWECLGYKVVYDDYRITGRGSRYA